MFRYAYNDLVKWKASRNRKPLIVYGARQVGKTWLIKEFAKNEYDSIAYIDLERDTAAANLFAIDLDPKRILAGLQNLLSMEIIPGKTLIVIDEIQSVKQAITSLKYFYDELPDYHIVAASSLLGVAIHQGLSFPVGKTDSLYIHPMNFCEFLHACGKSGFVDAIENHQYDQLESFHENIMDYLNQYAIVGGMPEVVKEYKETQSMDNARAIQRNIISDYENDFSKHANLKITPRIKEIYRIAPAQLAKENKKFIFSMVREGARGSDYDEAMLWLENSGLAKRITRCSAVQLPLAAYAEKNNFKLFFSDIGLLTAMANVPNVAAFDNNSIFTEFKGALAEQFVCQELVASGINPYYYHNDNTNNEVDFIIDPSSTVIPIETKSGSNLNSKSLNAVMKKYNLSYAIKFSSLPHAKNGEIENFPLYMAGNISQAV